jgi:carbon-monoxide dehydrogenase medium subunit
MKPASFEYHDPETVGEVVRILAQYEGEAKIIAGGQSLMPLLNMRLARPQALVDLRRVPGLDYIRRENGGLAIGSLTRQRDVERSADVAELLPLLHAATRFIAHPQIRNRGTVGGSLAHADPAAELPAVALCLDARFTARGPAGERTLAAEEVFLTQLTTALTPTELLTEVWFPARPRGSGSAWIELARRHGDYALVGVAAVVTLAGDRIREARLALTGVGDRPVRARAAEARLAGEPIAPGVLAEAAEALRRGIDPGSDIHATAAYRRHVAGVLAGRVIRLAAARAKEAEGA